MALISVAGLREPVASFSLRVFTRSLRLTWMSIAAVTVLLEVIPIPLMPPAPFYAYCAGKIALFLLLGYFAPLAFWSFNVLNRGIILAALSACCVESFQGLLHHGHSFHWYELIVKLVFILIGFAFGLNARYDRRIIVGPLRLHLTEEHV